MTENFTELLITLFSSAGLAGALFAALLSHVLKKARADADRRRQERTSLEIMRCEGEAAAGELLLTLVAFVQGRCGEAELKTRGTNTAAFWKKAGRSRPSWPPSTPSTERIRCGRRTDCAVPLFTPFRKGAKTESDMERRRGFYRASVFLHVPPYSGKKAIRPQQQNAHIPRFCCDDIFCKRLTARIRQMPRYDQRPLLLCIADNSSKIQWATNTITNKTPRGF